jgi:hypothetical protein
MSTRPECCLPETGGFGKVLNTGYRGVPASVVDVDEGFAGNDQLKTNAVQTMKAKGVTSFITV